MTREPSWTTSLDGRRWTIALALLVFATFLIRARYFGNPLIDVDEEFYLLTGDRMLHGAIPYLDIWDRKPVGLFVLYAAIRLLGGAGILQYQIVAAGFAAATAIVIATIARRISSPRAALIAAIAYVPALAMNGGQGGQTPVFYNLPMALAALLIVQLAARPADPARIRGHGAAAMLLVGLALQIKYSAVFEGAYFGLALIWLSWRAAPRRPGLIGDMALWAGVALLPTLLAYGWYVGIGAGPEFLYANFTSIARRGAISAEHQLRDLRHIAVRMLPFAITLLVGEGLLRRHGRPWGALAGGTAAYRFVMGWLIAAVIGFAAFGGYFNHYVLPLLVPLCIAVAPTFTIAYRQAGRLTAALVLLALFIAYPLDADKYERRSGDAAYAAKLAAIITPRLHGRCLFIFYGEPVLYHLTHSCLATRWPFPLHLSLAREAPALGVDAMAETRRIMGERPPVVVDRLNDDDEINFATQRFVRQTLAHDYQLIAQFPRGRSDIDQIWALKGPPAQP